MRKAFNKLVKVLGHTLAVYLIFLLTSFAAQLIIWYFKILY